MGYLQAKHTFIDLFNWYVQQYYLTLRVIFRHQRGFLYPDLLPIAILHAASQGRVKVWPPYSLQVGLFNLRVVRVNKDHTRVRIFKHFRVEDLDVAGFIFGLRCVKSRSTTVMTLLKSKLCNVIWASTLVYGMV